MPSSTVLFPAQPLSIAELTAACLDGHLVFVGEGFAPPHLADTPPVRAVSLTPLIAQHWILCGPSAAWVYGARANPPTIHHAYRAFDAPVPRSISRRLRLHRADKAVLDTVTVGKVLVTSPEQTRTDLQRFPKRFEAAQKWLEHLCQI